MRNFLFLFLIISISFAGFEVETLPPPVFHNHSFALLSNSRYSVHSGFSSSLPNQVLANILWAMAKVPRIGSYREIYVATPTNVYLYDPNTHTLVLHLAGNHRSNANAAFEIGVATERYEEAGFATQVGLLASVAFWDSGGSNVVSCPMQSATNYANSNWQPIHPIRLVNVHARGSVRGLDTTCLAISSDSTLPRPLTRGNDTLEVLLNNLQMDSLFISGEIPLTKISQILWAGYGVAPHMTANNRRGLTVPSAVANYYLTGKIYLVRDSGVYRYHNRLPSGSLNTADHRLQLLVSGDRRGELRSASPRIPQTAPVYLVVTVTDTTSNYQMLEAGFVGIQFLLQAQSLGLASFLTCPLSPTERNAIRNALSLPSNEFPVLVSSVGERLTALKERYAQIKKISLSSPNQIPIKIEFWVEKSGIAQFFIYDLSGRPIRSFKKVFTKEGYHYWEWDGRDEKGENTSPGIYFLYAQVGGRKVIRKIVKIR